MSKALFDRKDKSEADGLVEQFLIDLTTDEQRELLAFMQGFKLAKGLGLGMETVLQSHQNNQ